MALLQIRLKPVEISWSKNPVSFRFSLYPYLQQERDANTRIRLSVFVETAHYNSSWKEVKTYLLRPDEQGFADVDIATILNAQLSYDYPALDGNLQVCLKQARRYYVRAAIFDDYGQVSNALNSPAMHVVKGGLGASVWSSKWFDNYLTNARFLTWKGTLEKVTLRPEQDEFLYFLCPAQVAGNFTIRRSLVMDDGSKVDSAVLTTSQALEAARWQLLCIRNSAALCQVVVPAGRTAIGLYTEIFSTGSGGFVLKRISALDPVPMLDEPTTLMWRNSLGGMDTHVFTGLRTLSMAVEKEVVQRIDPTSFFENNMVEGSLAGKAILQQGGTKAESGWVSRAGMEVMRDLLKTPQAYELRGGRWVPVMVDAKTVELYSNRDGMYSLAVAWADAFQDANFTPDGVTMVAQNPEVLSLVGDCRKPGTATLSWILPAGYSQIQIEYASGVAAADYFLFSTSKGYCEILNRAAAINSAPFSVVAPFRARVVTATSPTGSPLSFGPWTATINVTITKTVAPIARRIMVKTGSTGGARQLLSTADMESYITRQNGAGTGLSFAIPNGAGSAGGTFALLGGGVQYFPPNATFSGTDSATYSVQENSGLWGTTTNSLPATERIFVTVEAVAGSAAAGLGLPYIKLELRNPRQINRPDLVATGVGPFSRVEGADAYATFWKDALATIPYDLTGAGVNLTLNTEWYVIGNPTLIGTINNISMLATGTSIKIAEVPTSLFSGVSVPIYEYKNYLVTSALFITL